MRRLVLQDRRAQTAANGDRPSSNAPGIFEPSIVDVVDLMHDHASSDSVPRGETSGEFFVASHAGNRPLHRVPTALHYPTVDGVLHVPPLPRKKGIGKSGANL